MRNRSGLKWKFVAVADHVQPGIGEKIGTDRLRQMRFEISHARTDFHNPPGRGWVNQGHDSLVKPGVDPAQQWLALPDLEVALDFGLVLRKRRGHGMNFNRVAANITMRNNSQPCRQRWMLVSP